MFAGGPKNYSYATVSSVVLSISSARDLAIESHCGRLCSSRQPLWYIYCLGNGHYTLVGLLRTMRCPQIASAVLFPRNGRVLVFGLSNNNKWRLQSWMVAVYRRTPTHIPRRLVWSRTLGLAPSLHHQWTGYLSVLSVSLLVMSMSHAQTAKPIETHIQTTLSMSGCRVDIVSSYGRAAH